MKKPLTALLAGAALLTAGLEAKAQTTNTTVTVTNNATLTWNWTNQFLLQYTQPALGTIAGTAPDWYDTKKAVNLSATPTTPAQYSFANWSGVPTSLGAQTNNASISFNLDAPYTPVANFALRTFALTVVSQVWGDECGDARARESDRGAVREQCDAEHPDVCDQRTGRAAAECRSDGSAVISARPNAAPRTAPGFNSHAC